MESAAPANESSESYLASHPITLRLRQLGATDEHLAAMNFRDNNVGWPFDRWSFTWGHGTPLETLHFMKAYCDLKWLILDDPPYSRDKEDAWRLVRDEIVAPIYALGLKFKEAQKRRAKKARGKIPTTDLTIREIIGGLAHELPVDAVRLGDLGQSCRRRQLVVRRVRALLHAGVQQRHGLYVHPQGVQPTLRARKCPRDDVRRCIRRLGSPRCCAP